MRGIGSYWVSLSVFDMVSIRVSSLKFSLIFLVGFSDDRRSFLPLLSRVVFLCSWWFILELLLTRVWLHFLLSIGEKLALGYGLNLKRDRVGMRGATWIFGNDERRSRYWFVCRDMLSNGLLCVIVGGLLFGCDGWLMGIVGWVLIRRQIAEIWRGLDWVRGGGCKRCLLQVDLWVLWLIAKNNHGVKKMKVDLGWVS